VANNIFVGDKGTHIKFYMLQKEDHYGNPYMIARSLNINERKNRKKLVFLGSANYENKLKKYYDPKDRLKDFDEPDRFV